MCNNYKSNNSGELLYKPQLWRVKVQTKNKMNRVELLKKMLPGLLPLLVFIIVDEFLGTKEGIIFALIFGVVELVFIYIKEKRIDKFVIVDNMLLVAF